MYIGMMIGAKNSLHIAIASSLKHDIAANDHVTTCTGRSRVELDVISVIRSLAIKVGQQVVFNKQVVRFSEEQSIQSDVIDNIVFDSHMIAEKESAACKVMNMIARDFYVVAVLPDLYPTRGVRPIFCSGVADDFRVQDLDMARVSDVDRFIVMMIRLTEFDGEAVKLDVIGVVDRYVLEAGAAVAVRRLDRHVIVEFKTLQIEPAVVAAFEQDRVAARSRLQSSL